MWNNGVNESFDPNFGSTATYVQDFGFENDSQYDYPSSYAHSSAAPSETDYAQTGGSKPKYYSGQAPKSSRRDSARSVAQPQVQYTDSTYYSSATMSPTMDMEFFPTYPQSGHDFNQDYLMYDSPSADTLFESTAPDIYSSMDQADPESPNASSDAETSGSSNGSIIPPRSHPLYNASPQDDGLYHCPYAATEDCGHEPKMLKCEYE